MYDVIFIVVKYCTTFITNIIGGIHTTKKSHPNSLECNDIERSSLCNQLCPNSSTYDRKINEYLISLNGYIIKHT